MTATGSSVLVTGSTGLVGSAVLQALDSMPCRVRAMVRTRTAGEADAACGVHRMWGDLLDASSLLEACRGMDTVIHCAACLEGTVEEVETTVVRGTRRLIEAARRTGVRRVVYVSSTAVYRAGPMHLARESYPRGGSSPYARAKQYAEDEMLAAADRLEVVVIRPPAVYGARDRRFVPLLARLVRDHVVPLTRAGGALMSLASVEDVATALVRSVTVAVDGPEIFNVASGPPRRVAWFLDVVARTVGVTLERFEIPDDLPASAEPPPGWAERTALLARPPVPWPLVHEAHVERSLDTSRAQDRLGFRPAAPQEEALARAVRESRHVPGPGAS